MDLLGCIETVQMRHADVEQSQIGRQGPGHRDRADAIAGGADHRVAERTKILLETQRGHAFVLSNEDT